MTVRHYIRPLSVFTFCCVPVVEPQQAFAPVCPECAKKRAAHIPQRSFMHHDQPMRYCYDFTPAGGSAASTGRR